MPTIRETSAVNRHARFFPALGYALLRGSLPLLLPLAQTACIERLGEERSTLGSLQRDCRLPLPTGVTELGAPAALEYPNETLFVWQSLALEDGTVVKNAAARASDAAKLCESGPELLRDERGVPRSLLQLNEAETLASNRQEERRLELVPVGGFVHEGVGYLYYEPTWFGPGFFDAEKLGTGLCLIESDEHCRRLEVGGDTLLFPPTARPLNQGGLVVGERALIYGCSHAASFNDPCTLSSAPLSELTHTAAYRVYNEFDGWVEEPTEASILFDRPGPLTVSRFRDGYAAVGLDVFDSGFGLQFARSPSGPFPAPEWLFQALPPDGPFPSGGKEHSGLRRSGRTLHVTYFTGRAGDGYGLHLASFELFGEPR